MSNLNNTQTSQVSANDAARKATAARWLKDWSVLCSTHADWVLTWKADEAIYFLPAEVIAELGKPRGYSRQLKAVLTKEEAKAETDFAKMCRSFSEQTVGVWQGQPLQFDLFSQWRAVNAEKG